MSDKNSYLKGLREHQEKQYLPGYFTGGNLPLALKYPTRKLGWLLLFISLPMLVVGGMLLIQEGVSGIGLGGLVPTLFIILYLAVALRLLLKKN